MAEDKIIHHSEGPRTRTSLATDFRHLGLREGMTVIVHSSMSSLGWVCGGALTVIQALQDVITANGTIIMPTHSTKLSDPKEWENPPIPRSWWQTVRNEMPAFDPALTPTFFMGKISELFRTFPSVKRSNHPKYSFAAWGKHQTEIISNHSLENGLGKDSPLGKIYQLGGYVLLLGTGYNSNTSMHLGEHHSGMINTVTTASPVVENGQKRWKDYQELKYDEEIFPKIGEVFETQNEIRIGNVGSAEAKLIFQPAIVDFTAAYICEHMSE